MTPDPLELPIDAPEAASTMPTRIKIAGVTANCGNSTMGVITTRLVLNSLRTEDGPHLIVINCQEVDYKKQLDELTDVICAERLALRSSHLMRTITKAGKVLDLTGIATFIVYNPDIIKYATLEESADIEVRGPNKNKGGLINHFNITPHYGQVFQLKTISGHLDSNSDHKRAADWQRLKRGSTFTADTWEALVAQVPMIQMGGYDANTRERYQISETTGIAQRVPTWRTALSPSIAPIALAPIGHTLYSARNTYKVGLPVKEDKKRRGYVTAGALDFVALQNNSAPPTDDIPNATFYQVPILNLKPEGTDLSKGRDHNVLMSPAITLMPVTPFNKVRYYLMAELQRAAPTLAQEIAALEETPMNQMLLLALHQHYLSPTGKLIAHIAISTETEDAEVRPWFFDHTLQSFLTDQLSENASTICSELASNQKMILPFSSTYRTYTEDPGCGVIQTQLQQILAALTTEATTPIKREAIKAFQTTLGLISSRLDTTPPASRTRGSGSSSPTFFKEGEAATRSDGRSDDDVDDQEKFAI